MAKIKEFLKKLIPPIILSLFGTSKTNKAKNEESVTWSGDYLFWGDAKSVCTGYDDSNILEHCKAALLKVKNGEAIYERDSVVFDKIQYSCWLLVGLQKAALENDGRLYVLDFGGSLGSSYYQNQAFLNSVKDLRWCIIEQSKFVDCGKAYFENEQLRFYHTIEECMKNFKPNVLLLSSVLQYLEKPYQWIEKFVLLKIPYIIIDRTSFADVGSEMLTVQNVPEQIYGASYPCWFFNERKLLEKFKGYTSLASFESYCDHSLVINSLFHANWKGHVLKLN